MFTLWFTLTAYLPNHPKVEIKRQQNTLKTPETTMVDGFIAGIY